MRLFNRVQQEIDNVLYEIHSRNSVIKEGVEYDVPYVCQFAIPEHAELSLKKTLNPAQDPHWAQTGARSPERYAEWAFTMCGMASVAMALGYYKNELPPKPAELAEDALKHGVYVADGTAISSMKYKEFAVWVEKYGLRAKVLSRLSIRGIQYALSEKNLVIISVNPNIRGYNTAPTHQKGGHLVLVTGYDTKADTISIHNPSGFVGTDTQINHTIQISKFKEYFAGRGIVLSTLLT